MSKKRDKAMPFEPHGPHKCEHCSRDLKPGKHVWLELDQRTNTYTEEFVPQSKSQGGFTFGPGCAKVMLRRDAKARAGQVK